MVDKLAAKWQNVKLQWPNNATAWLDELEPVNDLIQAQQSQIALNINALGKLVSDKPSELSQRAARAIETAEHAIKEQFSQPPLCLCITPFQPNVGHGNGYNKYLSAPDLIKHLALKLTDNGDANRPNSDNLQALVVLFLSIKYRDLYNALAGFNQLLNIEELEKAQRRALYLAELETNRQVMPKAGTLPKWQPLDLAKTTLIGQLKNTLTDKVASLQSYTRENSVEGLKKLLILKNAQEEENAHALNNLKQLLKGQTANAAIKCTFLPGGNIAELKKQLLTIKDTPSYEWILCAGVMFIGKPESLSFIKEVVGL